MKNILLISFALVFVGGCDKSSNPVAVDTSCTAGGCTATGCASDCACGCDGAGGCDCATNCTCVDGGDDDGSSTTNAVSIANMAFSPSTTTISKGTTVTWTNNSTYTHSVVSDVGSSETWDSGSLSINPTFSYQFDNVGEFGYKCGIHSFMTGSITITE